MRNTLFYPVLRTYSTMISKVTKILRLLLLVQLCLLSFSQLLCHASVTLTVGNGSGLPGSQGNQILVSLENPDGAVKGVQADICDVDDYLSLSSKALDKAAGLFKSAPESSESTSDAMEQFDKEMTEEIG